MSWKIFTSSIKSHAWAFIHVLLHYTMKIFHLKWRSVRPGDLTKKDLYGIYVILFFKPPNENTTKKTYNFYASILFVYNHTLYRFTNYHYPRF